VLSSYPFTIRALPFIVVRVLCIVTLHSPEAISQVILDARSAFCPLCDEYRWDGTDDIGFEVIAADAEPEHTVPPCPECGQPELLTFDFGRVGLKEPRE
jgi:hypothetical protein